MTTQQTPLWPLVFYVFGFGLTALCSLMGAVGMVLDWEPSMWFLTAAGALFGVMAVVTMLTYFIGRGRG